MVEPETQPDNLCDKLRQKIRKDMAAELLQTIDAGGDAYSRLANIKKVLEAECQKATELSIAK